MQDSGTAIHPAIEKRFTGIEAQMYTQEKKLDKISNITVRNGKTVVMPLETCIGEIWESTRNARNKRKLTKILADYPNLEKIIHYFKWGVFWAAALVIAGKIWPESIPALKAIFQLIK